MRRGRQHFASGAPRPVLLPAGAVGCPAHQAPHSPLETGRLLGAIVEEEDEEEKWAVGRADGVGPGEGGRVAKNNIAKMKLANSAIVVRIRIAALIISVNLKRTGW